MSTTKNYGLTGIGADVQLGKAGGRFVWSTDHFEMTSDGSTLSTVRGATPVNANDLTTKDYVDSLASGLDPKESVRVATTADVGGTYSAVAGSGGTGGFTGMANTIDGVSLALNDRILVKDQTTATENGIYIVTTVGTGADGVWERSGDQDGSPSSEVSSGNYTFVEQGTVNVNSGWVTQGDGLLTLNTDNINWVQFTGAGSITAGAGLTKSGETLSVDLFDADGSALAAFDGGTVVGTDRLIIGDASTNDTEYVTIDTILNDMDVVKGITANGMLARTADDTYASRTITASTVAGEVGLTVTNGDGVAGDPTIGYDITGTTAVTGTIATTDVIIAHVTDTDNANVKVTFGDIFTDLDVVSGISADGILVRTAADTYASRTIQASTVAGDEGISVVQGDGIAGNPEIGLDIVGLGTKGADALDGTNDYLVFYNADTTGAAGPAANQKMTLDEFASFVAGAANDNTISEGDSSIVVADSGTGTITTTVDGTTVATSTASGTTFNSIAVSDLTATWVLYAGTGGEVKGEAGFTYTEGTDTLSAVNIDGTTQVVGGTLKSDALTSGRVVYASTDGELVDDVNFTYNGTTLTLGGTVGLQVGGNATVSGDLTVTGNIDSNLTQNSIVFAGASGVLSEDNTNFTFDDTTDTMAVTGIIDIDNLRLDGNTLSSTDTNGDINLVPNGTGEVVIGSSGAGQIIADDNQSLTVAGGASASATAAGDLILSGGDSSSTGNGGSVTIQGGTSTSGTAGGVDIAEADGDIIMQFLDSGGTAVNHFDITAAATGSNPKIEADGTDTDVGIDFVTQGDGYLVVNPADTDGSTYATLLDSGAGNELVNKKYVDDAVSASVTPGSVGSVSATVDFTSATAQTVGTIPANATVLEVTFNVGTASDAATTVTFGDGTNGAAAYAAASENDPETTGIYVADTFVVNGGADVTAQATVATAGTVGSGTVVIRYRNA